MRHLQRLLFLAALSASCWSCSLGPALIAAQDPTGIAGDTSSLTGKMTDQTGATVSNAKVALTTASGVRLGIPVNDQGVYSVTGIYPGSYTLIVSAANYADRVFENINLTAGGKLTIDATLRPATSEPAGKVSATEREQQRSAPLSSQAAQKTAVGKGAIRGTATDQTGAVVPDAKAVLTSLTGEKHETPVNDKGTYSFAGLAPGTYTLIVSAPNFADMPFDNITVTTGLELTLRCLAGTGERQKGRSQRRVWRRGAGGDRNIQRVRNDHAKGGSVDSSQRPQFHAARGSSAWRK